MADMFIGLTDYDWYTTLKNKNEELDATLHCLQKLTENAIRVETRP